MTGLRRFPTAPALRSAPSSRLLSALAFVVVALTLLWAPSAAFAEPDITMVKEAPGSVLYGDESPVTLRVSNPGGEPTGYNLTIRDVLPAGVSYVPDPLAPIAPTIINDQPEAGQTTLIFDNVSDLSENSSYELTYRVSHSTTLFSIGDSYTNDAFAYISDDARFEPEINPDGTPGDEHIDGSASASATTQISAIEVVKSEPSSEGEILRGVHKHKTVYTLTVNNNAEGPTEAIRVEDWLPAGLEFLGCAADDNTTDAPTNDVPGPQEYPGSGLLNADPPLAPHPNCVVPDTVETVGATDPDGDGPMPEGVYTHVVWNDVADLEIDGQTVLQYVAGIPLRENTMTWSGGLPPAITGAQGSNLDNNSGPETFDEQELRNYALATGTFEGNPATDDFTLLRHAEDLAVHKGVNTDIIVQGEVSIWSLLLRTSEYRYTTDVAVTDTLPDGLCPLGDDENFENDAEEQTECAPDGVHSPSPDYTSATEGTDGRYTIVWDQSTVPELDAMQPSSTFEITFPSRTRDDYQHEFHDGTPILAEDSWTNDVSVAGTAARICAPNDPECDSGGNKVSGDDPDPRSVTDVSAASQHAEGIHIDKRVMERPGTFVDCDTGTYVDSPTTPKYSAGDTVCWQLRIEFPNLLDTGQPTVRDFLPPGVSYVPGSAYETPADSVEATLNDSEASSGLLTWTLPDDVPPGDKIFEWRFETTVGQAVADLPGEVEGNLMKVSFPNTEDETFPMRDSADIERSQALLGLVKGVRDVNDGTVNGPNVDGATVVAGDDVTFRVDIENTGDLAAENAVVWDDLQDGIDCGDVDPGQISDGGVCTGTRIVWSGLSVPATGSLTLTYDVEMPAGVEPGRTFNDHAGVVGYTSETNTGDDFPYVPADNIDPAATNVNAPAADDTSHVETPGVSFEKTRTTSVTESGNSLESEATIGEQIDYTATIVIPAGTTLYGTPTFTDPLGTRQQLVTPPDATATLNGNPVDPSDFTLDTTGNTVSLTFLDTPYVNAAGSGADTIEVKFTAQVLDVPANHRVDPGHTLTNTAHFAWEDEDGDPHDPPASVTTTIVEPDVAVEKAHAGDDIVEPNETVDYTVTARNQAGTRVSVAHDLELVDTVPTGMTPVLASIADGGVWDDGPRTITWPIASIAPGADAVRTYSVTVDEPAVVGEVFDNEADLTATSLAGNVSGERTAGSTSPNTGYAADATDSVSLEGASLTKSVLPGSATIGNQVTYTAEVVFPAGITFYDATVIDTLPDGMVFDETVSVECAEDPCTPPPPVASLPAEPRPDGTTLVGWYLDDLPSQATARTYTITYKAHVAKDYVDPAGPVNGGDTLTNSADAFSNGQDLITTPPTSIPDPGDFEDSTGPDTADVDVVEPHVTIDKGVSGDADDDDARDTQPGDSYTYSLVVTNDGDAPAYDVDVTDTPDATRLDDITPVANPDVTITDGDGSDGSLGWRIPGPIAPDGSVTITYTADLAPSAELSQGDTVVNTADVTRFWGASTVERTANPTWFREYTDVPDDTVTLTVRLPELTVDKTAPDGTTAEIGEPFTWRVAVTNASGYATADAVDVSDVLPPGWDYVDDSASFAPGGQIDPTVVASSSGDELTWDDVTDLGPGDGFVLTFDAVPTVAAIANGTGAGSPHVNDASATGADASGATASADGPYEDGDSADAVLELPDISVNKTPDGDVVDAGAPATYEIEIVNDGEVPARDVVVTDVLGAGQAYTAGDATASPTTGFVETSVAANTPGAGQTTIGWTIATIPANSSVTITVPIDTDPSLPAGTDLVNDASVVSREITTPVANTGGLETDVSADVGIDKQAQAAPVEAGAEMDYTIEVHNYGPSDAENVTVHDDLPDYLTFVSVDDPDCEELAGDVTCEIGDLAAGDSVEITLRVEIDPNRTADVSNTATVISDDDTNPANDSSTADKPVGVAANMTVQKQAPTEPVLQGTTFDYTIEVANTGVSAAQDVTLEDALPAGVTFESVDNADCEESPANVVVCDFGTVEPDVVIDVTVTALAVDVGTPTNVVTVSTTSDETTTDDNEADADVTIVPAADLGVTKSAPATVEAGGQIPYTLEVTNNGPSAATGVTLSDTLPVGVEFLSSDDPACTAAAAIVTCAVGDLAVSESRSYTITVAVPFALADQELTNSVVVNGNEGDLVPDNDSDQATTTVGPAADVSISKTSNGATAGGTASWTLVVANHGPSTADPVTVADTLPAGTTLRSASPGQGSCGGGGTTVSCDLGAIAAGGSTQISIVADVPAGTAGHQLVNQATVTAPQPDPDPSNNTDQVTATVSEPAPSGPNLTMSKTASTGKPELGKSFSYKLVVRNIGDAPAEDVRVVDTMSKAVDVDRVTTTKGRCERDGIEVECMLGTLAAGEQETVRLVVTPTGTGRIRNVASVSGFGQPDEGPDSDGDGQPDLDPTNNADAANVRVTAAAASWRLTKRASRSAVRGGETVRFAIRVRVGRRAVANAQVCDRLPAGLVFVRARGARFRDGRACWTLRYLAPGARRTLRIVARAERGFEVRSVRNVAVAKARNAVRRSAAARVRIDPAFGGAGGGVTG